MIPEGIYNCNGDCLYGIPHYFKLYLQHIVLIILWRTIILAVRFFFLNNYELDNRYRNDRRNLYDSIFYTSGSKNDQNKKYNCYFFCHVFSFHIWNTHVVRIWFLV